LAAKFKLDGDHIYIFKSYNVDFLPYRFVISITARNLKMKHAKKIKFLPLVELVDLQYPNYLKNLSTFNRVTP